MEPRRGKIETAASMTKTWNKFVAKVWNCGLEKPQKSEISAERAADKAFAEKQSQVDSRLVDYRSGRQTQAAICTILLSLSSLDETESFEWLS